MDAPLGLRVRQILEGCGAVRLLYEKAVRTSYLNHSERVLLLYTLGHLGEEGREALHTIIGRTYNYRREVTERHIGRLLSNPISCGRIREMHPELTAAGQCQCSFRLRGRGYPTPLLFALRPSEVPAFRGSPGAARTRCETGPRPSPSEPTSWVSEAETLLARLAELRRHQRGIEKSLAEVHHGLDALFTRSGQERIEVKIGSLIRRQREDGGWDYQVEL